MCDEIGLDRRVGFSLFRKSWVPIGHSLGSEVVDLASDPSLGGAARHISAVSDVANHQESRFDDRDRGS
ncbi:hypothetical protein D3C87_1766930 [compost metagenome]